MVELPDDVIDLPNHPDLPGLIFRRFRGKDDYPGIAAVGNAPRKADGQDWVQTADDIARVFAHLVNSDLEQDMLIAEIDNEMVGFTRGEWQQEAAGPYRYWFAIRVLPDWRGHGIRRAMLHWIEARLRHIAADHPVDQPKTLTTFAPDKAHSMIALLESEGYQPVRYFFKMLRSLDEPLPDFAMPAGLEMRPVLPEHHRAIWEASEEAFRDHWGYSPASEEHYQEWLEDPVIFTPELWQIAWDVEKDQVAGQVRTFIDDLENEKSNRRRGYTEFISVRRPYRRRGLARALIAESLRLLKARGMIESALTVDTQNLSGALRLYEACGFKVDSRSASYHKPLE
jgi:GNAT superfamily N-acetyltransferase